MIDRMRLPCRSALAAIRAGKPGRPGVVSEDDSPDDTPWRAGDPAVRGAAPETKAACRDLRHFRVDGTLFAHAPSFHTRADAAPRKRPQFPVRNTPDQCVPADAGPRPGRSASQRRRPCRGLVGWDTHFWRSPISTATGRGVFSVRGCCSADNGWSGPRPGQQSRLRD